MKFNYLVMLSHSMDDVPVLLVEDSESAFEFAETVAWEVMGTPLGKILDLPDMDTPNCVSVVTFRDGVPCSRVVVRTFDDDDDGEDDSTHQPTDPSLNKSRG